MKVSVCYNDNVYFIHLYYYRRRMQMSLHTSVFNI